MRKLLTVLLLLMFLPNLACAVVKRFNMTIDIQEDGSTNFYVLWKFTDDIKEVMLPIEGKVVSLEEERGKCSVVYDTEKFIVCKPPSPFMVGVITVKVKFNVLGLVERRGNVSHFSLDVPILIDTDHVVIRVILPKGMFVSENVLLPISPSGSVSSVKERRIVETWNFKDMRRGDIIPLRIYYEPVTATSPMEQVLMLVRSIRLLIGFIMILITFFLLFLYRKAREDRETILSILNEDERLVVSLITNAGGKIVQRRLVDLSGFSKAKVSRIVKELCDRGVLNKERRGRKNIITLKRKFRLRR